MYEKPKCFYYFVVLVAPKLQSALQLNVFQRFGSPKRTLPHLTSIFKTKALSAALGTQIIQRDQGKCCLKLKVEKLVPKPHGASK